MKKNFFVANLIVIYIVVVVAFIVVFNMTVVENVFNNKFGYSTTNVLPVKAGMSPPLVLKS